MLAKAATVHADAWLKDVAPSTALRKWFGHRVERWPEFSNSDCVSELAFAEPRVEV